MINYRSIPSNREWTGENYHTICWSFNIEICADAKVRSPMKRLVWTTIIRTPVSKSRLVAYRFIYWHLEDAVPIFCGCGRVNNFCY